MGLYLIESLTYLTDMSKYGNGKKDKLYVLVIVLYYQLLPLIRILGLVNRFIDWLVKNVTINVNGAKFLLVDYQSFLIVVSQFEQWNIRYLLGRLKKGDCFLDVGAHIGKYSVSAARIVGDTGLVISIEANSRNYKILNKNIDLNCLRNVKTYNIAAWKEECELELYAGVNSGANSCKKELSSRLRYANPDRFAVVIAKPIDEVVKALGVKINAIKVDCGGAEFEALQGLKQTILMHHPYVFVDLQKAVQKETLDFLGQLDYEVERSTVEPLGYGSFLFTPRVKSK